MENNYLCNISEVDIKEKGLKLFCSETDNFCYYLQICDENEELKNSDYICHYEIVQIKNSKDTEHVNDKIYVEIHFENETYSPKFIPLIMSLLKQYNCLMRFEWRSYCPGIRVKDSEFSVGDKEKILDNLYTLKSMTLECLLKKLKEIKQNTGFVSEFEFGRGRKSASKRHLPEIVIEESETTILHEEIKERLIDELKKDKNLKIVRENQVNKINYIDVATMDSKNNGVTTFYEIKTNSDPRLCIRQALGQLMEYAYFPNVEHATKLVVVGTSPSNPDIEEFLDTLNKKFKIPISYRAVELNDKDYNSGALRGKAGR